LSGLDHAEVVEHSIMEVVEHQSSGSSGTLNTRVAQWNIIRKCRIQWKCRK
jgi:hypothetical protein